MRASAFTCSSCTNVDGFAFCMRTLLHRSPTNSRAMRSYIARRRFRTPCVFYIARRRFRTPCVLLHRPPTISRAMPCFYIARRRFRVLRVCFLHRTPTVSRATRVLFTSLADGFARYASFYIARRRFRTPCALLHRTPTVSRVTRVLFTSPGGDFTHCARFCIVTDDFARHAL